jgi:hypothetical protein
MMAVAAIFMLCSVSFAQDKGPGGKPPGGPGGGPPPAGAPEETLGQTGKNIKVLNDLPSSQEITVMDIFAGSLGVKCAFCHVTDPKWAPELDTKEEKNKAREMITMVKEINKAHFDGRPQVTCYTCHHGSNEPARTFPLPLQAAHDEDKEAEAPKYDVILAKNLAAVGGADAVAKVTSRVWKGSYFDADGKEQSLEIYQKGGSMYSFTVSTANMGPMTRTYNGTDGWMSGKMGTRDVPAIEKTRLGREAALFPVLRLQSMTKSIRGGRSLDTANGKTVYTVSVRNDDNSNERYYIDTATGLITRMLSNTPTMMGNFPSQVDYDDYRTVDGVKVPFWIKYSSGDPHSSSLRKFASVEQNAKIDDDKFKRPADSGDGDKH